MANLKDQEAIYNEDDFSYKVKILEDNSDAEWDKFKLKILEIIQHSQMFAAKIGEEFDVVQTKQGAWGGMWHLQLLNGKKIR